MFRSFRSTAASARRLSAFTRYAYSVGAPPSPLSSRCQPSLSFHFSAQDRQFLPRFRLITSPMVSACFSTEAALESTSAPTGDVKSIWKIEILRSKTANKHMVTSVFSCAKKYRVYFHFANCNLIYSSSKLSKFSATNSKQQSFMTWSSVNEKEVTKALENFISSAGDGTFSKKEMCNMYIEKLVRSGNLPDAAYLLDYLHNKQIHLGLITYNILLNAAGETDSFDLFAEIFKKLLLSSVSPDFTSYVNAAMAFRKMSDSSQLLKFIRDVSEITMHREPTVMNRIIYITAKSGQLDKSLMIFTELKKLKAGMDTVTFNTVLVMLGRAGIVDQMLSEFDLMKDLGLAPDVVTYNTLINCLRRLGRLDMCKSFAKEMVERGISLDLRTYTALIDGLGRAGHVDDAMRIFSEMRKSHCPSVYVYRAMLSNLRKAGKAEAALSLLEDMNSSTLKLIGPEDFKRKKKKMK